jgi:hypothetical protein
VANPFGHINLHGDSAMRGVTLALPTDVVRNFLPAGLVLGAQSVTPPGTHPVVLLFNDLFRARMSFPTLLPNLTYHEHSFGVPFAYLSGESLVPGKPGPYYFMPRLYLDSFWAILGGVAFWGFAKELASFTVTADRYTIASNSGQRLTSLAWTPVPGGEFRPCAEYEQFEPVRRMLAQPLISMAPASMGPFFVLSDFDKAWDVAIVKPLQTELEVDVAYVLGYSAGRYPASGHYPGIDSSPLGSYELRAPWRLTLPYPPLFSVGP